MDRHLHNDFPDMERGEESPLNFAVKSRDMSILNTVDAALRHADTALAYQPVVASPPYKSVAFYEGLIRVFDDTGRLIPAREFFPQAETSEIGRRLDTAALTHGLRALTKVPSLRLSINMSARSIGYPQWIDTLERGLAADPTVGERLILEINEQSSLLLFELVEAFIADMQKTNIAFALDDFGAHQTSFRQLQRTKFDILKYDPSYCRGISNHPEDQAMIKAIELIAKQFQIVTVGEGIEDAKDAQWLSAHGVDCLQGYFMQAPTLRPDWAVRSGLAPKTVRQGMARR